ncbi:MAG: ABC transporter substrate-binding protein [Actinomycetota bacterium]
MTTLSRRSVLALMGGMAAGGLPVQRARSGERKRILMLLWRGETNAESGFRAHLRAEGVDFDLIMRDAKMDISRVADFIEEARRTRPDLIYTWGTEVTRAVVGPYDAVDPGRHITDIPVVFTAVTAPVESGIVPSMGPSGRNVTGVSHVPPLAVQLKALLAYRPVTRIACLYSPATTLSAMTVRELHELCSRQAIELQATAFPLTDGRPNLAALPQTLGEIARHEPQFLYLSTESVIAANAAIITDEARRLRLPTFAATEVPLRNGTALCGLVGHYDAAGRMTAHKVLQVLRETLPPGRIPVERLSRFSYVVNMKVARELDLYPPLAVMDYAELML